MAHVSDIRTGGFAPTNRFAAFRATVAERFAKHRAYTRTLRELESMSFRELNDLGLAQADLQHVAYETVYGQ